MTRQAVFGQAHYRTIDEARSVEMLLNAKGAPRRTLDGAGAVVKMPAIRPGLECACCC